MNLEFVTGNPCVSAETARHRVTEKHFKDMADHDNHVTQALMKVAEKLACVGCMGDIVLRHFDYKVIDAPNGALWILSSEPVHPSVLNGKTINLHAGEAQFMECEDCTDGHNILTRMDSRYVNIDLDYHDFKPVALVEILDSLPERYR